MKPNYQANVCEGTKTPSSVTSVKATISTKYRSSQPCHPLTPAVGWPWQSTEMKTTCTYWFEVESPKLKAVQEWHNDYFSVRFRLFVTDKTMYTHATSVYLAMQEFSSWTHHATLWPRHEPITLLRHRNSSASVSPTTAFREIMKDAYPADDSWFGIAFLGVIYITQWWGGCLIQSRPCY
jgi:hypothetical protein